MIDERTTLQAIEAKYILSLEQRCAELEQKLASKETKNAGFQIDGEQLIKTYIAIQLESLKKFPNAGVPWSLTNCRGRCVGRLKTIRAIMEQKIINVDPDIVAIVDEEFQNMKKTI